MPSGEFIQEGWVHAASAVSDHGELLQSRPIGGDHVPLPGGVVVGVQARHGDEDLATPVVRIEGHSLRIRHDRTAVGIGDDGLLGNG